MGGFTPIRTTHSQVPTPGASGPKSIRAARQFEAMLLASVLGPLERTFSEIAGEPTMPGSEAYQSMGMQAVASEIVKHGGLGIGTMIASWLDRAKGNR